MAGQVIAGRYELTRRLGVGGMSTVHLAFDRRLERQVAVKLLAEHLAHDEQFVTRFRREALSVAQLVHPNIVQVFDFGMDEAGGRHYLVMEYVRGQSGAELLREHGHLGVDETLSIVTQACLGLQDAHRHGVVHRDVKPGNLLRGEDGVTKLADFGIAKAADDVSGITQVGSVLGTAAYLAPEQAHGEPAGPASDIYALGVVTYQLLSGRLPYDAQSLTELVLKQQSEPPPRLDHIVPGVTPELAGAVERAMALDPADRPASAEELRRALLDGVRGVGAGPTTATRAVPRQDDAATSIAAPVGAVGPATPTAPVRRAPREAPSASRRGAQPAAAPAAGTARARDRDRPRRRSGLRRLAALLLLLLLVGGGTVAAVVASSNDGRAVHLRRVAYDDVQRSIDAMQQLVRDNTR